MAEGEGRLEMNCPNCNQEVFEVDVKCTHCGAVLGATGAHRMLGQVILGTYELVDVLGQGGMSVVFKARHKMTEQEVALKILPPELAAHSQVKSRFLEEAKALAALDHPNIVHLYNFGQENGSFVLAMQFVQGKTWEKLILESKRLDWKVSVRITIDVLKALEYAHGRGVVHRDMKPSNVLVRAHDAQATVMDFGIAKMTTSTKLTATGQTMGTVRYMSPEQVRGQEVDLRTDIYSLGATLYESLVGDTPFDGQTHFEIMTKHLSEAPKRPSALGVELPGDVEDALMRSLAKKPEDRYESARELRKVLESALRAGDVGLVETQRLNREILGDVSAAKSVSSARAASAADLADDLEPGLSGPAVARSSRKPMWPWIALAVSVVAAGGVGAALLLMGGGAYKPYVKHGLHVTEGKKLEGVMIETDGKISPEDVATAYKAALAELQMFDPKVDARLRVLEGIVAIPSANLCDTELRMRERACEPGKTTAVTAVATVEAIPIHLLIVPDNKGELAEAMKIGLAHAVCDFGFDFVPKTPAGAAQFDAGCKLAKRFVHEN